MVRQRLGPERVNLEHGGHRSVGDRRIGSHIHGLPGAADAAPATGGEKDDKWDSCEVLGRHGIPP